MIDDFLEFCEFKMVEPEMKNLVEVATVKDNKKTKERGPSKNVVMTK